MTELMPEKKDWSGVCATTYNRNQCGENCVIFPICLIKKIGGTKDD